MKKIVFLFFVFFTAIVWAQTAESKLTFKIDDQEFSSTVPFDEKFKLLLESSKDIRGIRVRYRIKDHVKNKSKCSEKDDQERWEELDENQHYFQYKEADDCGYISTNFKSVNSKKFSISSLGLFHPNIPYEFQFSIYTDAKVEDGKDAILEKKLLAKINEIYLTENIPTSRELQPQIQKIVEQHGIRLKDLYDRDGNNINVKQIINDDLFDFIRKQIKLYSSYKDAKEDFKTTNVVIKSRLEILFDAAFMKTLSSIDTKNIHDKSLLTSPVNSLISTYKSVTLQDMMNFLISDFYRERIYTLSILAGSSKFNGNIVEPLLKENYYNVESMQLLASSLILIKDLRSKKAYFFSDTTKKRIQKVVDNIQNQILLAKKIKGFENTKSDISKEIPNILQSKYSQNNIKVGQFSVVDVESEATPYINSDIGMVYSTRLDDVFAAEIINLHAKPVNRKAFFNDLKGWDKFWKLSSLQLGIVQKLGGDNPDFNGVFGDVGTPYFGLGFRLNKMFRIGGGVIIYKENNPNPVISNKITKGSPSFSITFNSSLSDAFGIIGKLFTPKTP